MSTTLDLAWTDKLREAVDSHNVPELLDALTADTVSNICDLLAAAQDSDSIRDLVTMVIMQERLECAKIVGRSDSSYRAREAILSRTGSEQDLRVKRERG